MWCPGVAAIVTSLLTGRFIDEFGAAMLPFIIAIAVYCWRKRGELPQRAGG